MSLVEQLLEDEAKGIDRTCLAVPCKGDGTDGGAYELRVERVNSTAPMLQGVSALFMVLPKNQDGQPTGKSPALLPDADAKKIADILQALLLQAVTGSRSKGETEWKPLRLVADKAHQDLERRVVWINHIHDGDQFRCYDALVTLHTGEGMATLIATAFRFASDKLLAAFVGKGVRDRPVDGVAVEPGADDVQRGGDALGREGSTEGASEE